MTLESIVSGYVCVAEAASDYDKCEGEPSADYEEYAIAEQNIAVCNVLPATHVIPAGTALHPVVIAIY